MKFQMFCKIENSEVHNGKCFTVVTTPAPDAYSHPSKFKLVSPNPIGQPGQEMEILVGVSGIVRERNYRDKNTGQPKTFQEADVYLNVLNSQPKAAAKAS